MAVSISGRVMCSTSASSSACSEILSCLPRTARLNRSKMDAVSNSPPHQHKPRSPLKHKPGHYNYPSRFALSWASSHLRLCCAMSSKCIMSQSNHCVKPADSIERRQSRQFQAHAQQKVHGAILLPATSDAFFPKRSKSPPYPDG